MTRFYVVDPDLPIQLGPNTILEHGPWPPVVVKLHCEFAYPPRDELAESFPAFIATERLASALLDEGLTGVEVDEVEVSKSDNFVALFPEVTLPKFVWLKIRGTPGVDDFGVSAKFRLVVSARALAVMNLKHADVADFTPEEP